MTTRTSPPQRLALACVAAAILALPSGAAAFERTTTCLSICDDTCATAADGICQDGDDGSVSEDDPSCEYGSDCTDCGYRALPSTSPYRCRPGEVPIPVLWRTPCVTWHMNQDGVTEIGDFGALVAAVQRGFDAWNAVECSYETAHYGGTTDEDRPGYSSCGDNVNFVGFVEEDWNELGYPSIALALTSVTYDLRDGTIVDADIELNAANFTFELIERDVGTRRVQDVQNVVTHEVGHFLGLDHTRPQTHIGAGDFTAPTMAERSPAGDISKRDLHEDDIAGLCTIYPLDSEYADDRCNVPTVGFLAAPADAPQEECADNGSGSVRTRRHCAAGGNGTTSLFGLFIVVALTRRR